MAWSKIELLSSKRPILSTWRNDVFWRKPPAHHHQFNPPRKSKFKPIFHFFSFSFFVFCFFIFLHSFFSDTHSERPMETAICGRLRLSPNHVFNPKPGISSHLFLLLWFLLCLRFASSNFFLFFVDFFILFFSSFLYSFSLDWTLIISIWNFDFMGSCGFEFS